MDINLWDIEGYRSGQPIDQLLWLQENDPVHWHHEYNPNGPGFWALTRHADIKRVEADGTTFSSEPTTLVDDGNLHGPQDGIHKTVIFEDSPSHAVSRAFLGRDLTPKCVRGIADQIERLVTEILDDVAESGQCDVASDVGGRLASYVTADFMGLPRDEVVTIYEVADRINNAADLTSGPGGQAMADMAGVAHGIYERFRAHPDGSLVSHLVNDSVNGRAHDELQFSLDFLVLVDAGSDTTRNIVGAGLQALFDHPDQRELFLTDPYGLATLLTDEVLRYKAPISYQRRTTTVDTEIGGQKIAKGQKVLMWYPAGNRDPRVFTDPLKFDITRSPNPHFGFGAGRHFCLGAHLAKLELTLVFRELVRRFPDIEPAGEVVWVKDNPDIPPVICGPRSMPVRFTPAPRLLPSAEPVSV